MGLFGKIFKKKTNSEKEENHSDDDNSNKDLNKIKQNSSSSKDLGNKQNSSSSKDLSKIKANGSSKDLGSKQSSKDLSQSIYLDSEEIILNNIVIDNFFLLDNSKRFNVFDESNCNDKSTIFYKVWRTQSIIQMIFKHYVIKSIPTQSTVITITDLFNKKLTTGFIPETTKSVTFGRKFNQTLEVGSIPESVTYLKFGAEFSPLSLPLNVLPSNLKTLIFGQYFHTAFKMVNIPASVEILSLARCNTELLAEKLPKNVQDLNLGEVNGRTLTVGDIPESVTTLSFDQSFTNKNPILDVDSIPNTVKTLILGPNYNQLPPINSIPNSVASLTFGDAFNQPLSPGIIGNSVGMLVFGEAFNQIISPGCLPDCVNILEFSNYNKPFVYGALPNSIIYLDLGKSYNLPLANLPENLRSLKLGRSFKQQLTMDSLPPSITEIYLVPNFDKTLISYDIPKHILKVNEKN
ncbi:hypothetical protein ACTFIV_008376 [Dictyostelium citrinum]